MSVFGSAKEGSAAVGASSLSLHSVYSDPTITHPILPQQEELGLKQSPAERGTWNIDLCESSVRILDKLSDFDSEQEPLCSQMKVPSQVGSNPFTVQSKGSGRSPHFSVLSRSSVGSVVQDTLEVQSVRADAVHTKDIVFSLADINYLESRELRHQNVPTQCGQVQSTRKESFESSGAQTRLPSREKSSVQTNKSTGIIPSSVLPGEPIIDSTGTDTQAVGQFDSIDKAANTLRSAIALLFGESNSLQGDLSRMQEKLIEWKSCVSLIVDVADENICNEEGIGELISKSSELFADLSTTVDNITKYFQNDSLDKEAIQKIHDSYYSFKVKFKKAKTLNEKLELDRRNQVEKIIRNSHINTRELGLTNQKNAVALLGELNSLTKDSSSGLVSVYFKEYPQVFSFALEGIQSALIEFEKCCAKGDFNMAVSAVCTAIPMILKMMPAYYENAANFIDLVEMLRMLADDARNCATTSLLQIQSTKSSKIVEAVQPLCEAFSALFSVPLDSADRSCLKKSPALEQVASLETSATDRLDALFLSFSNPTNTQAVSPLKAEDCSVLLDTDVQVILSGLSRFEETQLLDLCLHKLRNVVEDPSLDNITVFCACSYLLGLSDAASFKK